MDTTDVLTITLPTTTTVFDATDSITRTASTTKTTTITNTVSTALLAVKTVYAKATTVKSTSYITSTTTRTATATVTPSPITITMPAAGTTTLTSTTLDLVNAVRKSTTTYVKVQTVTKCAVPT
jgi:hypothetical protein